VEEGGLGVKDIDKFNATLLAKGKWRFGVEKASVWRDILESRYDSWREMGTNMRVWSQSSW